MANIKVPYLDLKAQYQRIKPEIEAAIARVLDCCQFVLGTEVSEFEHEFATYCGTAECVALNSGTSALHLVLLAAGVGPGDEVIRLCLPRILRGLWPMSFPNRTAKVKQFAGPA